MSERVATSEELVRQRLAERLTQLAIDAPIVPYPAGRTARSRKANDSAARPDFRSW